MKRILFTLICSITWGLNAIEVESQFENEKVSILKAKIAPWEEIGLHRDAIPTVVIALKGGTITRLEANGTTTDVHFPTGVAVYRNIDPPEELHRSVNKSADEIELIMIQLK